MISKFILLFGHLNLALLALKKRKEFFSQTKLINMEVVKIFEYEKDKDGYWDGV